MLQICCPAYQIHKKKYKISVQIPNNHPRSQNHHKKYPKYHLNHQIPTPKSEMFPRISNSLSTISEKPSRIQNAPPQSQMRHCDIQNTIGPRGPIVRGPICLEPDDEHDENMILKDLLVDPLPVFFAQGLTQGLLMIRQSAPSRGSYSFDIYFQVQGLLR